MSQPYVGEIKLVPFNFAPVGWAFADGQIMAIVQNEALFALYGTTYGGDGIQTFGLPDLRGRAATHFGQGSGLSPYSLGDRVGAESVSLNQGQLPSHVHTLAVSSSLGTQSSPTGHVLAKAPLALGNVYSDGAPNAVLPGAAIANDGGGQPHENRQPYLGLNYIVALFGVFPPRP